jgi:UDPglucose--hexose-1-phosphate uridylyltransferase
MPELRKDPTTSRWVIVATERLVGPTGVLEGVRPDEQAGPGGCPFCEGNEAATPPEVHAERTNGAPVNGPGWSVRVVPNRIPALRVEGELDAAGDGLFDRLNGIGAHEVVIETPAHDARPGSMAEADLLRVLFAWRARLLDLQKDRRLRSVVVFKDHGPESGALLGHAHSQILALPIVPQSISAELAIATDHYAHKQRCLYCDLLRQETQGGRRVVYENARMVAVAPYAPRRPFETWIVPRQHAAALEHGPESDLIALAAALRATMRKLDVALDRPSFSYVLHSAPFGLADSPSYHWHLEILPAVGARAGRVSGLEWGSGFSVNPTTPEEAATFLREIPDVEAP